jgi:hypothetical protein
MSENLLLTACNSFGAVVDDYAYGAYKLLTFNDTGGGQKRETRPTFNAYSYVFLAMHIWISEEYKKAFDYPRAHRTIERQEEIAEWDGRA